MENALAHACIAARVLWLRKMKLSWRSVPQKRIETTLNIASGIFNALF